jgi:hypothetical protein
MTGIVLSSLNAPFAAADEDLIARLVSQRLNSMPSAS